jgi:hypothetical protein
MPGTRTRRLRLGGWVVAVSASVLVAAPSSAAAWTPVPDPEPATTLNPCTGQETTLVISDVSLLLVGGDGHEGLKFRGRFTTGDGFSGTVRDQDQVNEVPDGEAGDNVFSQQIRYLGADDAGRRVLYVSVVTVVLRDGEPVLLHPFDQLRCVGVPG